MGVHIKTGTPCAVKQVVKNKLEEYDVYKELMKNELQVLESTNHPHITRIFQLLEDKRNIYIVMELVSGGNLLDVLYDQKQMTEVKAAKVMDQLLRALNFMHKKNITHRDLKPENLLCEKTEDGEISVKLTDFGFACTFQPGQKMNLSLGSPLYMAPELCAEKQYDEKVDVWSAGVIAYMLVTGRPPFSARSKDAVYRTIQKEEPSYTHLEQCDPKLTDFIKQCFHKQAKKRPSVDELLQHPWIELARGNARLSGDRQLDISANLASFRKTNAFQSGVLSFITNIQIKSEQLTELKEMFMRLDKDHDGTLSIDELKSGMSEILTFFNIDESELLDMI